jgi:hypothetical protein
LENLVSKLFYKYKPKDRSCKVCPMKTWKEQFLILATGRGQELNL